MTTRNRLLASLLAAFLALGGLACQVDDFEGDPLEDDPAVEDPMIEDDPMLDDGTGDDV